MLPFCASHVLSVEDNLPKNCVDKCESSTTTSAVPTLKGIRMKTLVSIMGLVWGGITPLCPLLRHFLYVCNFCHGNAVLFVTSQDIVGLQWESHPRSGEGGVPPEG